MQGSTGEDASDFWESVRKQTALSAAANIARPLLANDSDVLEDGSMPDTLDYAMDGFLHADAQPQYDDLQHMEDLAEQRKIREHITGDGKGARTSVKNLASDTILRFSNHEYLFGHVPGPPSMLLKEIELNPHSATVLAEELPVYKLLQNSNFRPPRNKNSGARKVTDTGNSDHMGNPMKNSGTGTAGSFGGGSHQQHAVEGTNHGRGGYDYGAGGISFSTGTRTGGDGGGKMSSKVSTSNAQGAPASTTGIAYFDFRGTGSRVAWILPEEHVDTSKRGLKRREKQRKQVLAKEKKEREGSEVF